MKRLVYAGIIMEAMRESWTDGRLDDLNQRVGELSRRMDEGFHAQRAESKAEFVAMRAEIATLHRLMIQLSAGIIATIIATQIASRL